MEHGGLLRQRRPVIRTEQYDNLPPTDLTEDVSERTMRVGMRRKLSDDEITRIDHRLRTPVPHTSPVGSARRQFAEEFRRCRDEAIGLALDFATQENVRRPSPVRGNTS